MKVSILIPTAGRAELLKDMIRSLNLSLIHWSQNVDVEMVFVVDDAAESLKAIFDVSMTPFLVDMAWERRGALWAWNRALQLSSGDIIVPAGDDQIFHPNWLEYALESHKEKVRGYGVVGMNDLAYNGNEQLATMFIFDRAYCKNEMGGVFAPPMYKYYCIDSEWNAKAKILGRFYWDSRSIVEHLHSAHGKRPIDDLDREKMDAGWMAEDNKIFEERKAQGFPITWQPII